MQRLKKLEQSFGRFFKEDLMHVNIGVESAAMAYYMLLSVIPMVMLVTNILPLLPIPIDVMFKTLETILPDNITDVLFQFFRNYLRNLQRGRAFCRVGDFILAGFSNV